MSTLGSSKRVWNLVLFTVLLVGICVAPVLAEDQAPPVAAFNGTEAEVAAVEAEEAAAGEWLESPEAIRQRREALTAYDDLSAAEAQDLLAAAFPDELKELDGDPARLLSDLEIEKVVGNQAVLVPDEEGGNDLVELPIPVRLEEPNGEQAPVDLALGESGSGFVSETPAGDISLPDSLGGSIQLGDGIGIASLPGDQAVPAQRFGDKDLFLANSDSDTDTFIAPLSGGIEIFEQLRSPESPEQFRFGLSLPQGATLRADGGGGAEILNSSGTRIAFVPAPYATDAQGADVRMSMTVDGDALVVDVPHRSLDVAYPVLMDPQLVVEEWYWNGGSTTGLSNWGWSETADYENSFSCIVTCWGSGLYSRSKGSNFSYGANTWGQWVYTAPNSTAYITRTVFSTLRGDVNNCQTNQPHGYVGIFNVNSSSYDNLGVYSPLSFSAPSYDTGSVGGAGTRYAVVGIGTANATSQLACGHDFYVGGATIYQDDPENPTVTSVTGMPSGWITDTPNFTLTANTSDPGLGVKKITFTREGSANSYERPVGCTGTAASRCPSSRSEQFTLSGLSFDEGKKTATMTVEDATGKTGTQTWYTYVDRTKPDVTLSGQLAVATEEDEGEEKDPEKWDELSLPVYNLSIKATDIGPESNADAKKRSGVKSVEVIVDGTKKQSWEQTCTDSCSMEKSYSLKLSGLVPGKHTLEVIAADYVGQKRERKIEFEYIPATGMKDEYAMHYFPLPDGQGDEEAEERPSRPELAVNVTNGNLVYREKDVDVEGYAVDLEVERFYNSQLPESENTEWGDGWTLAQTPELDPEDTGGSSAPDEAEVLESSGAFEGGVELPSEVGEEEFDPASQATVTKTEGGFEVRDESGESETAVAFDSGGQAEALLTEGEGKVDLEYSGGELSEISIDDPASAMPREGATEEAEEQEAPAYQTPTYGTAISTGSYTYPQDAAVDPGGNIWVIVGNVVKVFNPEGELLRTVGSGLLEYPTGIAAASDGSVWVVDPGNYNLRHFNSAGSLVQTIGTSGQGNGQFEFPEGIAIGPDGKIWVADSGNNRVQKFSAEGAYLDQFGSTGTEDGELNGPSALDVDPSGNVWVLDTYNKRIQKFGPDGTYLLQAGTDVEEEVTGYPRGIVADPQGGIWVSDTYNGHVRAFDASGQYLGGFGTYGSGTEEMLTPTGIAADSAGNLWVVDSENSRVQRWVYSEQIPTPTVVPAGGFGSSGSGNGQFFEPNGITTDSNGNIWIADTLNSRIQEVDAEGQFIRKFGSYGTGNGQFKWPRGVAVDPSGNVWVADTSNNRIQKFTSTGSFLLQFGSSGTGAGQFNYPQGIAADEEGNIWVVDRFNDRIQKFNSQGQFVSQFGSKGSAAGQLHEPTAIAIDAEGKLWITDGVNQRVQRFNSEGKFIRKFGSAGSQDGEFQTPTGIAVDEDNVVWVADGGNHRIQAFTSQGKFLTKFGSAGSGENQLKNPNGIVATPDGNLLIADSENSRIRKWQVDREQLLPGPTLQEDPAVEVESLDGLVESVEGEEAGEHTYEHSGDDLVSHTGPEGETQYEYDTAGRMTRVELPNGTWGEIEYFEDGRVESVTVAPEGSNEKTTTFAYSDQPRRTTATPPDEPAITYEIGEDGSVLKWSNAKEPPEFEDIAGSLYDIGNRETATPINIGDYNLVVQAYSDEGIASIGIYANGSQLISEKTCPQVYEEPSACKKLADEWATYTGNHPPGILNLEMVIEDRLGQVASERFWVNIPYTPPAPPGAAPKPNFTDVLQFREEHGLDLDLDPIEDELEINDRVYDTINDWVEGKPVAVASTERWGAPLRSPEVAELEYRLAYWQEAVREIPDWAEANASGSFAGYYLDERAGGLMRVGFSSNQTLNISSLKGGVDLPAEDRIVPFTVQPTHTLASLRSLNDEVLTVGASNPSAMINQVSISAEDNSLRVGSSNVAGANSLLKSHFGSGAPISVYYAESAQEMEGRERIAGKMMGGERILINRPTNFVGECTTGFGAFEQAIKPASGDPVLRLFALTAAHCGELGSTVIRRRIPPPNEPSDKVRAGVIRRQGYDQHQTSIPPLDVAAVKLEEAMEPRRVYTSSYSAPLAVRGWGTVGPGTHLCHSGATTGMELDSISCGTITAEEPTWYVQCRLNQFTECVPITPVKQWCFDAAVLPGDSGGPVWIEGTNTAVGIVSSKLGEEICAAAIVPDPRFPDMASVLSDPSMGQLGGLTTAQAGG